MKNEARLVEFVKKHENTILHLYKDTRGNVTVGTGHLLPNSSATTSLVEAFSVRKTLPEAERKALIQSFTIDARKCVMEEYQRVEALEKARLPSYYKTNTKLDFSQTKAASLLKSSLNSNEKLAKERFSDFDNFPESAQIAVVDMVYNLGNGGFGKFTNLISAVASNQWTEASTLCSRIGVSPSRNSETTALFEEAARDAIANVPAKKAS